jgi:polar amino acid transport system substrate-binding protein
VAALLLGSCVPPVDDDLPERFSDETVMGAVQQAGKLRIGLPEDVPPLGFQRPGGRSGGMGVDLGRLVARALAVRAEFTHTSSTRLLDLLDRAELDLAFPAVALTEARLRRYSFTNPYVVAHQRLLVPAASGVQTVEDLAGARVCSFLEEATGADLSSIESSIVIVAAHHVQRCPELLRNERVEAVTADDLFLEYMLRDLGGARIVGDDLSTVGYAAVVTTGASTFGSIVEQVFADAQSDGTWAQIYRRWVEATPGVPPELTAEEAAALYPIGAQ